MLRVSDTVTTEKPFIATTEFDNLRAATQANTTNVLGLSNQSQELLFSGAEENVQLAKPPVSMCGSIPVLFWINPSAGTLSLSLPTPIERRHSNKTELLPVVRPERVYQTRSDAQNYRTLEDVPAMSD